MDGSSTRSLVCGCRFMCVVEEEEDMSYTAKDPPWSFSTPPCETHSLSTHQYNAPENDACVLA
jgi:hypothetical protein